MPRPLQPDVPIVKPEDPEPNHDVNALFSTFRLDQSSYRTFSRHRTPKFVEDGPKVVTERSRPEQVRIGVFSPMGGAGKSTLVAILGSILWQHEKKVVLVDAAPWPTLPFFYGATTARPGMRSFYAPGGKQLPVRILVRDQDDSTIPNVESYLNTDPADYILFDLSGVSGPELAACLNECQVVLVPLIPDGSAMRNAEAVQAVLGTLPNAPARFRYIINRMDGSPVAKSVYDKLNRELDDQLFKKTISQQDEIQESLAEGIVLPFFAPDSQAVAVCSEVVQWLELPVPAAISRTQQRWSER